MIQIDDSIKQIADRLQQICTLDYEGNASKMGREIGINAATVSRALNAEYEKSVRRVATLLIKKVGYSQAWIEEGRGEMRQAPAGDLHARQEKSHTDVSQSDIGLSPRRDDSGITHQPQPQRREHMEVPRSGSVRQLNVPQYFDIWMLGEVIATVEFARIIPGKRKGVDITRAALDMRYSPHDYPEIEEGPPPQGE